MGNRYGIKKDGHRRTYILDHTTTVRGREVWRLAIDGEARTCVTSATSAEVMDEAVRVYGGALERLAKR